MRGNEPEGGYAGWQQRSLGGMKKHREKQGRRDECKMQSGREEAKMPTEVDKTRGC